MEAETIKLRDTDNNIIVPYIPDIEMIKEDEKAICSDIEEIKKDLELNEKDKNEIRSDIGANKMHIKHNDEEIKLLNMRCDIIKSQMTEFLYDYDKFLSFNKKIWFGVGTFSAIVLITQIVQFFN